MCIKGQKAKVVNFWEEQITARWQAKEIDALEMVHGLLSRILIRHSKSQRTARGDDLVELTDKEMRTERVAFADASEEYVYRMIELGAVQQYAAWRQCGHLHQQMMRTIGLRDRLLRIASHPSNLDLESLHKDALFREKGLRGEGGADELLPGRTPHELLQAHACESIRRLAQNETPVDGSDWFTCPVCLSLMGADATITPCSHVFCYQCINAVLSGGAAGGADFSRRGNLSAPCPQCRRTVSHRSLVAIKMVVVGHKPSRAEEALAGRLKELPEPRFAMHALVTHCLPPLRPCRLAMLARA